jgi:hypothetical protein
MIGLGNGIFFFYARWKPCVVTSSKREVTNVESREAGTGADLLLRNR